MGRVRKEMEREEGKSKERDVERGRGEEGKRWRERKGRVRKEMEREEGESKERDGERGRRE